MTTSPDWTTPGDAAEKPPMASYGVTGDSNQTGTTLTLAAVREDAGWSSLAPVNEATFTGSPDRVRISAITYMHQPQSGLFARINPGLLLQRNGVTIARSATGYERHSGGHDSSSNTISFIDPTPGVNPVYRLRAFQENASQGDVLLVDLGAFSLEAVL